MSTKRSTVLRGLPTYNEYGAASEQIKPGYLVKGVSTVAKQTGSGWVPRTLAVEREELGAGFDNTYQGSSTISAYYASGDKVKVAHFAGGMEATVYVASGQNITEDDYLESAGDGTFKEGSTNPIARALETLGAVTTETALRVAFL